MVTSGAAILLLLALADLPGNDLRQSADPANDQLQMLGVHGASLLSMDNKKAGKPFAGCTAKRFTS